MCWFGCGVLVDVFGFVGCYLFDLFLVDAMRCCAY